MLLHFPEQQYQSYTSENKKSKQTNNTLEEMSKNQSFRILKLYLVILYREAITLRESLILMLVKLVHQCPQGNDQFDDSQKNMLSFMKNDEIKRQHISSEQLFQELQQSKQQINGLREENIRLRTKIQHSEVNEKYIGRKKEISLTSNKRNTNDYTMIVLRKQLKERTSELEDKMKEIEMLKRNVKVCRMQELEIEKKVYFEQTLKMKHMLNLAQDQIGYQQMKVERTQTLEQQIEQQNITMDKMQNKHDQMLQYMEECDQAMKMMRQQLKQQTLKNQQLIQKHQQLQIKFDNLNNVTSSNILLGIQIVKCCNNSPITINLENKIRNLAKEIISASEDIQRRHRNKGTNDNSKNSTEVISKQTSEYFQFPKDQIYFTLLKNKVTQSQFDNLLTQLKNCKDKLQFQAILLKEPISLVEPEYLVNNLNNHNLYQQFSTQLGPYISLENVNELETQKIIKQSLQQTEQINKYWETFKGQLSKQEILTFITQMKFDWNQQTILYYLLNIFQNGNNTFNSVTLEQIKNPFPTVEDSFLRDLQVTQNANKILDNFNPQDELLVKEFFTPDNEDLQFEHQLGLKSNKYVQPNQIQEALEEEEEVQSSMNKEENYNDLAYIESNNNGELELGSQSLKILND